jgi:CO/xanthine dehydrogenase FAD-binding subunit
MAITVKTVKTLAEAASLLAADRQARYFGGGTLLMRALNEGDPALSVLVRTTDARLHTMQTGGPRIILGAGVTMAQILADRNLAVLHATARLVGGPAVRTAASLGGNLFAPSPYGDLTVALLALDATVSTTSSYGAAREMPLEELLSSRDRMSGGIIEIVSFNRPVAPEAFRFRKVSRVKPKGISVLSIAAHLPQSGGRISQARVAYGAMAATPIRAKAVERALEGRALDDATIADAVRVAAEGLTPPTDALASSWYRREVIGVHLRRLLLGQK